MTENQIIIKDNNEIEITTQNNEIINIEFMDTINIITVGKVGSLNFFTYPCCPANKRKTVSHSLLELKNVLNTSNNLIIVGIRNPIDRNLSFFYQMHEATFTNVLKMSKNNYNGKNIVINNKDINNISINDTINNYFNTDIHTDFNDWFTEFFEITGINQKTFNKEEGLDFYNLSNNNKIMIYTLEKLDSNTEKIKKILNTTTFENGNNSQEKFYKDHYNTTKAQITYTQSYLDSQLNTDIMNFFYSDEDIQGFYNKYTIQN